MLTLIPSIVNKNHISGEERFVVISQAQLLCWTPQELL